MREIETFPDGQVLLTHLNCFDFEGLGFQARRLGSRERPPSGPWLKVKCPDWTTENEYRHRLFQGPEKPRSASAAARSSPAFRCGSSWLALAKGRLHELREHAAHFEAANRRAGTSLATPYPQHFGTHRDFPGATASLGRISSWPTDCPFHPTRDSSSAGLSGPAPLGAVCSWRAACSPATRSAAALGNSRALRRHLPYGLRHTEGARRRFKFAAAPILREECMPKDDVHRRLAATIDI